MPAKNKIVARIRGEKRTPAERKRLEVIRAAAKKDFPPRTPSKLTPAKGGIAAAEMQRRLADREGSIPWDKLRAE